MLRAAPLQLFIHLVSELQNHKIWACWELSGKKGNLSQTTKWEGNKQWSKMLNTYLKSIACKTGHNVDPKKAAETSKELDQGVHTYRCVR